jgi:hypothetical protein
MPSPSRTVVRRAGRFFPKVNVIKLFSSSVINRILSFWSNDSWSNNDLAESQLLTSPTNFAPIPSMVYNITSFDQLTWPLARHCLLGKPFQSGLKFVYKGESLP